jgi:hypothetical protein
MQKLRYSLLNNIECMAILLSAMFAPARPKPVCFHLLVLRYFEMNCFSLACFLIDDV